MADINQIITLGIGSPGDIEHLILDGLNVSLPATTASGRYVMIDVFQPGISAGDVFQPGVSARDVFQPGHVRLDVF